MKKLLIACDLHNTLVLSGEAWIEAYARCTGEQKDLLAYKLSKKVSRHKLAEEYNVSYTSVYAEYVKVLQPNFHVIDALNALKPEKQSIVVISAAPQSRVEKDVELVRKYIDIKEYYFKENFCKRERRDWDKLIEKNECTQVLYFGNDFEEDVIKHEKVVSAIIC